MTAGAGAGAGGGRRSRKRLVPRAWAAVPLALAVAALPGQAWLWGAAAAAPQACGLCAGCSKKSCKFDDSCFYDAAVRTCQDVGANRCRGIQKRHGPKAPPGAGGPGRKKNRCTGTSATVDGFESQCVCQNKKRKPSRSNKKGRPKKCRFCGMREQDILEIQMTYIVEDDVIGRMDNLQQFFGAVEESWAPVLGVPAEEVQATSAENRRSLLAAKALPVRVEARLKEGETTTDYVQCIESMACVEQSLDQGPDLLREALGLGAGGDAKVEDVVSVSSVTVRDQSEPGEGTSPP